MSLYTVALEEAQLLHFDKHGTPVYPAPWGTLSCETCDDLGMSV